MTFTLVQRCFRSATAALNIHMHADTGFCNYITNPYIRYVCIYDMYIYMYIYICIYIYMYMRSREFQCGILKTIVWRIFSRFLLMVEFAFDDRPKRLYNYIVFAFFVALFLDEDGIPR